MTDRLTDDDIMGLAMMLGHGLTPNRNEIGLLVAEVREHRAAREGARPWLTPASGKGTPMPDPVNAADLQRAWYEWRAGQAWDPVPGVPS